MEINGEGYSSLFSKASLVFIKDQSKILRSDKEKFLHLQDLFDLSKKCEKEECLFHKTFINYPYDVWHKLLSGMLLLTTCHGDINATYLTNELLQLPTKSFLRDVFMPSIKEKKFVDSIVSIIKEESWTELTPSRQKNYLIRAFVKKLSEFKTVPIKNYTTQDIWQLYSVVLHCALVNQKNNDYFDEILKKRLQFLRDPINEQWQEKLAMLKLKIRQKTFFDESERRKLFSRALHFRDESQVQFWFYTGILPATFFRSFDVKYPCTNSFYTTMPSFQLKTIESVVPCMNPENLLLNFFKSEDQDEILANYVHHTTLLRGIFLRESANIFCKLYHTYLFSKRVQLMLASLQKAIITHYNEQEYLTHNQRLILIHPLMPLATDFIQKTSPSDLAYSICRLYEKFDLFHPKYKQATHDRIQQLFSELFRKVLQKNEQKKLCSSYFSKGYLYNQMEQIRLLNYFFDYAYIDDTLLKTLSMGHLWYTMYHLVSSNKNALKIASYETLDDILQQSAMVLTYDDLIDAAEIEEYAEPLLYFLLRVCEEVEKELARRNNDPAVLDSLCVADLRAVTPGASDGCNCM